MDWTKNYQERFLGNVWLPNKLVVVTGINHFRTIDRVGLKQRCWYFDIIGFPFELK
jgi:hypothetical protein